MTRTARITLERIGLSGAAEYPVWVPPAARYYLAHTEKGRTIRDLAREARVHPSTILRQVRRVESCREDPLVDSALRQLSDRAAPAGRDDDNVAHEALPVLQRLAEPDAVLAVARDMEKGVIVREEPGRDPVRLAVVERALAEAMALRDWIVCPDTVGRIRRYRITAMGRTELRKIEARLPIRGFAEAPMPFAGAEDDPRLNHMRSALGESPLLHLARRRDDKGQPFLTSDQMRAGERLREDFVLALRGTAATTDWTSWLSRLPGLWEVTDRGARSGPEAARTRVERALADLGPGLADVALCCCCLTEGLEVFERRMGWSARSGKVVLRIALGRLGQHYRAEAERCGEMIG